MDFSFQFYYYYFSAALVQQVKVEKMGIFTRCGFFDFPAFVKLSFNRDFSISFQNSRART